MKKIFAFNFINLAALPAYADFSDQYFGGSMIDWMMGGRGFGGYMFIIPFIFFLFLAWMVFWFFENAKSGRSNNNKDDEALRILKERYAKGEIDKKEFQEKKKDLS